MLKFNRKGQNTLEYVLLITCVVLAFIAIQYYLNRGIQGRVREASDNIGNQFESKKTASKFTTVRSSSTLDETTQTPGKGMLTTSTLQGEGESSTRTGTETVFGPFEAVVIPEE